MSQEDPILKKLDEILSRHCDDTIEATGVTCNVRGTHERLRALLAEVAIDYSSAAYREYGYKVWAPETIRARFGGPEEPKP